MNNDELKRKQRQEKLANLFFEMGMDLDLVEKMSGIDKKEFLSKRMSRSSKGISFNSVKCESNNRLFY